MDKPEVNKSVSDIIEEKGIKNVSVTNDEKTLVVKQTFKFSNSGKRKLVDYQPTEDELLLINKYALVDLNPEDVVVFNVQAADKQIDRQYEQFTDEALRDMAELSKGKAFLTDHEWETEHQIGLIFDAAAIDGKLMQKVYVLNTEENKVLIKNILGGVFNKVSVGFSIDLADAICMSCRNKSIYSQDCPHMPGGMDEEGNKTYISIKNVIDYFEVSIVPVPAQRDAGIRRNSLDSTKTLTVNEVMEDVLGLDPLTTPEGDLQVALGATLDETEKIEDAQPAEQIKLLAQIVKKPEDWDEDDVKIYDLPGNYKQVYIQILVPEGSQYSAKYVTSQPSVWFELDSSFISKTELEAPIVTLNSSVLHGFDTCDFLLSLGYTENEVQPEVQESAQEMANPSLPVDEQVESAKTLPSGAENPLEYENAKFVKEAILNLVNTVIDAKLENFKNTDTIINESNPIGEPVVENTQEENVEIVSEKEVETLPEVVEQPTVETKAEEPEMEKAAEDFSAYLSQLKSIVEEQKALIEAVVKANAELKELFETYKSDSDEKLKLLIEMAEDSFKRESEPVITEKTVNKNHWALQLNETLTNSRGHN